MEEAKKGERHVLFVDASHFVHSPFSGSLWCQERIFIRSPSGRQRHNVLGAFNSITHELITVKNDDYVNARTVMDLIKTARSRYGYQEITLIMDNARYQRCAAVMECAREWNVELLFIPPYSPNLNLIERLWKFVKKKALNCKFYENFELFKKAIDDCLKNLGTKYKKEIESLMSLNFHIIRDNIF